MKIVVRHPVPSLNRLFAMTPFDRQREKKKTQAAFLFALEAIGADSSTLTTFARNTSLIASGMRGLSETTLRKIFASPSNNSKSNAETNEPKSKSQTAPRTEI